MTYNIITRWETLQMPKDLDKRIWRQLRGAFGVQQLIFVEDDDELLEAISKFPKESLVWLEPKGKHSIKELPDGDMTLVLGNTQCSNMQFADPDQTYKIDTPNPTDFYGVNAAAIALAFKLL